MEKRLAYSYGRALVVSRLVLFVIVFALVGTLIAVSPYFPVLSGAVFLGVLALALVVFALSPLWTQHWLTRSRLVLRQGWYFRVILPFADITSLEAVADAMPLRAPLGIHRPLGQATLFVTGGRHGLLVARLDRPRRFWSSFGLEAANIVFDVSDPEGFLQAFAERRSLLPPVQADGPDAQLRD
jgi:hypothetical protein